MSKQLTWREKILNAANRYGEFNRNRARRLWGKNITEKQLHGTVMREASRMVADKLLRRVSEGNYAPFKK